jgi:hypothetical protein
MTAEELVKRLLTVSQREHSQYTHEQHLTWVMGLLAATVLNKNHMDNVALAPLLNIIKNY